ncbi:family 43 glycosylhydrolase [Candidatus Sumerlaeota bacterium]|nr:family 43 glycosylhydrolase [Candidatus Sumerlaeota bacterium]
MKSLFTIILCIILSSSFAESANLGEDFFNPLDVLIGDPQILKDGASYYLYGTTGAPGFEVFSSTDLVNWRRWGFCWTREDKWAQNYLWAPEVIKSGGKYYMFYTGSDNFLLKICVASSDSPIGPFTDIADPMYGGSVNHFDPSPFYDPASERFYLYYTKDVSQSGSNYSEIWGGRIAPDFKSFDDGPYKLFQGDQSWEITNNKYFIEGPNAIKNGSCYYMQYSGSAWNSKNYAVGYATATAPLGPWTKFSGNPILKSTPEAFAPGHGCFTLSPDETEHFIVYHKHLHSGTNWRELGIDRMDFIATDGDPLTPDLIELFNAPTRQACLLPCGAALLNTAKSDDFSSNIDRNFWHIQNEESTRWNLSSGALNIIPKTGNAFLQFAPKGDFSIETRSNFPCPGLADAAYLMVFQDNSNHLKFMRINRYGLKIEMEKMINGVAENFAVSDTLSGDYFLRIVKTGDHFDAFYSDDGTNWTPHNAGYDIHFDKEIQIGIGAQSPFGSDPPLASFDYFNIIITNPAPIGVDDEFTTEPLDRDLWLIHNENPETWSISGGALNIQTEEGDEWRFRRNARNLFLQKAPDSNFAIKAKVTIHPEANFEQAMLLMWSDHNNFIKLASVFDTGLKFEAASESGGNYASYQTANTIGDTVFLKIIKTSNHYDFYVGANDTDYTKLGSGYDNPMNPYGYPLKIGLGAISPESGQSRTASFDFFRVEKSPPVSTPTPTRLPLKFMLLY